MSKLHAKKKRPQTRGHYKPREGSNAAFIAEHLHLPPPEIVRLAKQQKRNTTLKAVYTARSQLRKRGFTAGNGIARPAEAEVIGVVPRSNATAADTEQQLRRLLLQLGSITVRRLLTEYEQQIEQRQA